MTEREELTGYIWDAYKDANGIRPRWIDFDAMSIEQLSEMADRVSDAVGETIKAEKAAQAAAAIKFEAKIADLVGCGAGDRETAVRWLLDGDAWYAGDSDALRYEFGLVYNYAL